jgi:hypothetical protein
MLKRLAAILLLAILVGASGAFVGYTVGSVMYANALQRVQTNPRSIRGNVGGYLCSVRYLAADLGVFGMALGVLIGLGIGIGEAAWTAMIKPESEQE